MIVTTAQLFKEAYGRYAVGAYNINNMEQALGLFHDHVEAQAPGVLMRGGSGTSRSGHLVSGDP